jgi:stearoyl-CoA desaturase (delta-9 desaturase)
VPDLARRRLLIWQHRHYPVIGGVVGFLAPLLLGWAFGDPWGGLIVGGFTRLVFVYQATFAVNSFAHWLGSQPYSDANTSRDSTVTALLTMGEGYHNFHHTFPADYRNGFWPHQFDPTKWIIWVLAAAGLARNLRRAPAQLVERARRRMEERRRSGRPLPAPPAGYESMRRERGRRALAPARGAS